MLVLPRPAYGATETQPQTGLEVAIAHRADAALADLGTEAKQVIARRIFLRLIQFGEGRPDTRRQQLEEDLRSLEEDSQLFNATLQHLASRDRRLLTFSGEESDANRKVDIAHEALISGWGKLQQWINQLREAEKIRRRLREKAREWTRLEQKGGLLDEAELLEAETWLSSNEAKVLGYDKPLYNLITASREKIEQVKRLKQEQQERELKLIEENLKAEKLAKQKAQTLNWVAGIFSVVLTGATIFAAFQWRNAEIGQIRALSESSTAKFTSNRSSLVALLDALKAGKRLKRLLWLLPINQETELRANIMTALTQAVFWVKEKNRLEDHFGEVSSVSFSPDGKTIATASGDSTIKLWQHDGSNIATLQGHKQGVTSVSFHPKEQILVSGSLDGTVRLWEKQNNRWTEDEAWQKIFTDSEQDRIVRAVSFSLDGRFFAAGGDDETVKIWALDRGKSSKPIILKGHGDIINSLSFSPNGQIIVTASHDGTIKLWKWQENKVITEDKKTFKNARVGSVRFSPDGKWIVAGSLEKGTVKLWQWNGQQLTGKKPFTGHSDGVRTLSFSSDSKILASAGEDNIIKLWQLDGTPITKFIGHTNFVLGVSFSPDKQILASASQDNTVKFWQLDTQLKVISNSNNFINSVSCSSHCDIIAAASEEDNKVKLWRSDGTPIDILDGHTGRINNLSISSDGRKIASASKDSTIKLWQLDENGMPKCGDTNQNGNTNCYEDFLNQPNERTDFIDVSFSPDNEMIAIATREGKVQLWRLKERELIANLKSKGHKGIAYDVSFSPNGEMLASAGGDGIVKLWNTEDGTLMTESEELDDKNYDFYKVRFNPDSNMIAAASTRGSVKLWKIEKSDRTPVRLEPKATLSKNNSPVTAVSFSPDGEMIASGNDRGTIFLWKPDGTLITELSGHSKYVTDLNFSSDSKILVSGSDDASIILWNLDEWSLDNLSLDSFITLGCSLIQDYLKTNPNIERDRHLCTDRANPAYLTQKAIAINRSLTKSRFDPGVCSSRQRTVCCLSSS